MRILLCDDHALFREGLELVLSQLGDDVELIGVEDAETALARVAADDDLDLVLLDLQLPGMSGLQALARLRALHPDVPVLIVAASERPEDVRAALDCGAAGFIPKSTRGGVLLAALRLVLSGEVYVPPMLMASVAGLPERPTAALTPRQVEVLRLLAHGLTNKQICRELGIAEGTVKTHVMRIYEVLGVSNRTEAARRMRELRIEE